MKRRAFLSLLAGAAAPSILRPLAARAQPSMPVIGFLTARGPGDLPRLMAAFHNGLKSAGFVEGQNVAIEYRFADSRNERLPALAADLVQRQVTVISAALPTHGSRDHDHSDCVHRYRPIRSGGSCQPESTGSNVTGGKLIWKPETEAAGAKSASSVVADQSVASEETLTHRCAAPDARAQVHVFTPAPKAILQIFASRRQPPARSSSEATSSSPAGPNGLAR
jgi:hypothetical protein